MANKIKASWELTAHEINFIESDNEEVLTDQVLYSCARQLKELDAIRKRTQVLIQELEAVQSFFRGIG